MDYDRASSNCSDWIRIIRSTKLIVIDDLTCSLIPNLDADFNILRDYIDRFQQGTWPDPNAIVNTTPSPAETDMEFACED